MRTHGNNENLFHRRACSLVRGSGCAEKWKKGMAAARVAFLVKAMYLAQKVPFALVKRQSVKKSLLDYVLDERFCGTDQKRSFLCL